MPCLSMVAPPEWLHIQEGAGIERLVSEAKVLAVTASPGIGFSVPPRSCANQRAVG
ncbi:hypothetical protein CHELA1G11_70021 [Hyphomicrobiales bacterium]|nr:hypothetical protein CHELA1G2_60007 [Hyphomicrobiales bacterium]CAH1696915.1 hypothetical protein CHELA1G11_70021 [Hyphomicrobiales bacterium]